MAIVIMGVSGCGKSTIGRALSKETGLPFYDADDYHPQANIDKMQSGIPLTDEDRIPWLAILSSLIKNQQQEKGIILACSALKKNYRKMLDPEETIKFIYLKVSREELIRRLETRKEHYMPARLLDSQLETLELSNEVISVNGALKSEVIVTMIGRHLKNLS